MIPYRLTAALLLAAAAIPSIAQTPADVTDLVGARAAGGETQLEARGYEHVTTNKVRDTAWSFWWSERRQQCLSIATTDGRYASIGAVPAANCSTGPVKPAGAASTSDGSDGGQRGGATLSLVCIGSGAGPAAQSNSGYSYNPKSKKFEYGMGTTLGREGFASDVEIEIRGNMGRIHPSGKLVSPIHSGGQDGWWAISELMVTPDRITGRYRLNGMNQPRIDYDRHTRLLKIKAATDFTGRCEEQ